MLVVSLKRVLAAFSISLMIVSPLAAAGEAVMSQIMPKAAKSLLLDVESAGQRLVAVGQRGHILFSDDQGQSWQQAKVPTRQMVTAVTFADKRLGWAVAHDGLILQTQDGGQSWEIQHDGLAAQKASNLKRERDLKHKVNDLQEQLSQTPAEQSSDLRDELDEAKDDLEIIQERLAEEQSTSPLLDVYFADKNRGWATGAFGKMLATNDGGKTWRDISTEVGNEEEFHINAVTGEGDNVFLVGEYGLVIRSQDLGKSWEVLEIDYDGTFFAAELNNNKLVIAGLRGNAFISSDLGDNFIQAKTNTDLSLSGIAVSKSDPQHVVLVGSGGAVIASHDGGANFALFVQANRLGLSAVEETQQGKFIIVGLGGAAHFSEQPN